MNMHASVPLKRSIIQLESPPVKDIGRGRAHEDSRNQDVPSLRPATRYKFSALTTARFAGDF